MVRPSVCLLRALSPILVPQLFKGMATRIWDASRTNMEGTVAVTSIMQVMVKGVGYGRVGLKECLIDGWSSEMDFRYV